MCTTRQAVDIFIFPDVVIDNSHCCALFNREHRTYTAKITSAKNLFCRTLLICLPRTSCATSGTSSFSTASFRRNEDQNCEFIGLLVREVLGDKFWTSWSQTLHIADLQRFIYWLMVFNGTSTQKQKGQFAPTGGGKLAQAAKNKANDRNAGYVVLHCNTRRQFTVKHSSYTSATYSYLA